MAEIILAEGAVPGTPSPNTVTIYAKVDGLVYSKADTGVETALGVSAGGAVVTDELALAYAIALG